MKKLASRVAALSLSCVLALSLVACNKSGESTPTDASSPSAEESGAAESQEAEATEPGIIEVKREANQLIIGDITDMDDNMLSGWTNPGSNALARTFMSGGYTGLDGNGQIVTNKNFGEYEKKRNDDGTLTVTVKLNPDAKWSDGQPLTAADYAVGMLVGYSKELAEIDNYKDASVTYYVGAEDYLKNGGVFKGFRLLGDHEFSFTIKAEESDDYYTESKCGLGALPKHVICPDAEIKDDGEGVYFVDGFKNIDLQKTINDKETGYRYTYTPNLGPYSFASFDRGTKVFTAKINPNYPGNFENVKPTIATLVIKKVNDDTKFDELKAGTVDLLNGILGGDSINAGLNIVKESNGAVSYATYPRAGYGKIAFHCDFGPTKSKYVRQAIAYLLDREDFAKTFTGGHGSIVHGPYGLGMPEYIENKDALNEELNDYAYNPQKAIELLEQDGWNLNEKGEPYVQAEDGSSVRYKKNEDGSLEPLKIQWMSSTGNPVSALISTTLLPNAKSVGLLIEQTAKDFGVLLDNVYRESQGVKDNPQYSMFNLATGFPNGRAYPWFSYSPELFGQYNTNFIDDPELYQDTLELKKAKTKEEWLEGYKNYCIKWNELLPDLPLYSDEMHDFYSSKLKDYSATATGDMIYFLLHARIEE